MIIGEVALLVLAMQDFICVKHCTTKVGFANEQLADLLTEESASLFVNGTGGAAFTVGAGVLAGAVHISMLFIGRVSLGIGVGFANQVSHDAS